MPAKEKMLVRLFYEEIVNKARFDKLGEIFHPKITWHDPLIPAGEVHSIENFKNVLKMFRSAFPDLHTTIENRFKKENKWSLGLQYGARIKET